MYDMRKILSLVYQNVNTFLIINVTRLFHTVRMVMLTRKDQKLVLKCAAPMSALEGSRLMAASVTCLASLVSNGSDSSTLEGPILFLFSSFAKAP